MPHERTLTHDYRSRPHEQSATLEPRQERPRELHGRRDDGGAETGEERGAEANALSRDLLLLAPERFLQAMWPRALWRSCGSTSQPSFSPPPLPFPHHPCTRPHFPALSSSHSRQHGVAHCDCQRASILRRRNLRSYVHSAHSHSTVAAYDGRPALPTDHRPPTLAKSKLQRTPAQSLCLSPKSSHRTSIPIIRLMESIFGQTPLIDESIVKVQLPRCLSR